MIKDTWAVLSVDELTFSPELLECCKSNACGNYNKSWSCPPACGTIEEQRKKILSFKKVFVFSTIHDIEDSFDYEGMARGRELHAILTFEIKNTFGDVLIYGAGSCPVCKDKEGKDACAFPKPCRFPDQKINSLEAAGIDVAELCKTAGLKYNNGPNTVTFFSIVLLP